MLNPFGRVVITKINPFQCRSSFCRERKSFLLRVAFKGVQKGAHLAAHLPSCVVRCLSVRCRRRRRSVFSVFGVVCSLFPVFVCTVNVVFDRCLLVMFNNKCTEAIESCLDSV